MHKKLKIFNHVNPFAFVVLIIIFLALAALPLKGVIQNIPSAYADQGVLGDNDEDHEDEEDHEEEDEEENHEDEEDEKESSSESEEKVQNSNGTTSTIKRHTEDDGGQKLEIKTYNYNGDLVEEKEYESGDEKAELQIKQFDNYGNKLLELKYKDENNNEIKLQIEGDSTGQSKVRYDFENQKMYIEGEDEDENESEDENENEIEIEVDGNRFKIKHNNTYMHANFPIVVDEETGKIYVVTGNGRVELKQLPDAVVAKALESKSVDEIIDTSLSEEEDLRYSLEGNKKEKLFGLLNIDIQKTLIYDPESGELIDISLEPLQQILDYISF